MNNHFQTLPVGDQLTRTGDKKMKTVPALILAVTVSTASILAAEPPSAPGAKADAGTAEAAPKPTPTTNHNDTNTLLMNFHGASLDLVLNHLSEAAGFVINIKPGT